MPHKGVGAPDVSPKGANHITLTTTDNHHEAGRFHSSLYRPEDGYVAPSADDRREHELLAELKSRGYGITVPCLICRRPLTSARSLAAHIGPVCRARMTEAVR